MAACRRCFLDFTENGRRAAFGAPRLRAGVYFGEVAFTADGPVAGRSALVADMIRKSARSGEMLVSSTVPDAQDSLPTDATRETVTIDIAGEAESHSCLSVTWTGGG